MLPTVDVKRIKNQENNLRYYVIDIKIVISHKLTNNYINNLKTVAKFKMKRNKDFKIV